MGKLKIYNGSTWEYATSNVVGTNEFKLNQIPAGLVNGSNKLFTTTYPYISGTLEVFIRGIKQTLNLHYTETVPGSGTFTMDDAPEIDDVIEVTYQRSVTTTGNADTLDGEHLTTILQAIYPIGAVYVSGSNTMPALISGIGTWTRLNGRVIVGLDEAQTEFDTVNETGGHKAMQRHRHNMTRGRWWGNDSSFGAANSVFNQVATTTSLAENSGTNTPANYAIALEGTGDSQNLQPYKVKYMWERTA